MTERDWGKYPGQMLAVTSKLKAFEKALTPEESAKLDQIKANLWQYFAHYEPEEPDGPQ